MEFRQMTTAFIFNENKVLMIKKSLSQLHNSVFWSGLGGHLEPNELNKPREACLREIYEESGIVESDIDDLRLRYILLRIKEDEIRQQFVYFGKTKQNEIVISDEGELFWIDESELLDLDLSRIIRGMLEHYLLNKEKQETVVGVITLNDYLKPEIKWSDLKDPMVF